MDDIIVHKKKEFLNLSLIKDELESDVTDASKKVDVVSKMVDERLKMLGNQISTTSVFRPELLTPTQIMPTQQ